MFKIYGSEMCPDCMTCKKNFDYYNVEYEFIDINASLRNLKEFLKYRDSDPVFNHCKEIDDIGLPALIKEDGTVFLSWEKYLEDNGMKVLENNNYGEACSLDRKGC